MTNDEIDYKLAAEGHKELLGMYVARSEGANF
jgi:transposase-like protein